MGEASANIGWAYAGPDGSGPSQRLWAMHGHIADSVRAVPAVRGTACCQVMRCAPGAESVLDLLVGDLFLAVDAVGVDGQGRGDYLPGPGADVQPQGQGGVSQVIGAAGQPGGSIRFQGQTQAAG